MVNYSRHSAGMASITEVSLKKSDGEDFWARLAQNWAWDAGLMFACPSGMPGTVTTHHF